MILARYDTLQSLDGRWYWFNRGMRMLISAFQTSHFCSISILLSLCRFYRPIYLTLNVIYISHFDSVPEEVFIVSNLVFAERKLNICIANSRPNNLLGTYIYLGFHTF